MDKNTLEKIQTLKKWVLKGGHLDEFDITFIKNNYQFFKDIKFKKREQK